MTRKISFQEPRPNNQIMIWSETLHADAGVDVYSTPLFITSLAGSIALTPLAGAGRVEISFAGESVIKNSPEEAVWVSWPAGDVTSLTSDTILNDSCATAIRIVAVGGATGADIAIQAAFGPV